MVAFTFRGCLGLFQHWVSYDDVAALVLDRFVDPLAGVPAFVAALQRGALGAGEVAAVAVQVQAVAEIVAGLHVNPILVVQGVPLVTLVQAPVELALLPLAVLRVEIPEELLGHAVHASLPRATSVPSLCAGWRL